MSLSAAGERGCEPTKLQSIPILCRFHPHNADLCHRWGSRFHPGLVPVGQWRRHRPRHPRRCHRLAVPVPPWTRLLFHRGDDRHDVLPPLGTWPPSRGIDSNTTHQQYAVRKVNTTRKRREHGQQNILHQFLSYVSPFFCLFSSPGRCFSVVLSPCGTRRIVILCGRVPHFLMMSWQTAVYIIQSAVFLKAQLYIVQLSFQEPRTQAFTAVPNRLLRWRRDRFGTGAQ